jgi:hypothetical protein
VLVVNATRWLHIQGVPSSFSRSNQRGAKDVQSLEDTAGRSVYHFRDKHWGPCAETAVCFLLIILLVFTVEIAALQMKTNSDVKVMKDTSATFTR